MAQWLARLTSNQGDVGSSPAQGIKTNFFRTSVYINTGLTRTKKSPAQELLFNLDNRFDYSPLRHVVWSFLNLILFLNTVNRTYPKFRLKGSSIKYLLNVPKFFSYL